MSSGKLSPGFYISSFIISLVFLIVAVAYAEGSPEMVYIVVFPAIYLLFVFLLLIYKAWKAIQWEGATIKPGNPGGFRITPGRAVAFFFIPFVNIAWPIVAIYGWARNYNAYLLHHRLNLPFVSERLFLFFVLTGYVIGFISNFPALYDIWLIVYLIYLVIGALTINEIISGVNRLVSGNLKQKGSLAPPSLVTSAFKSTLPSAVTSACKFCGSQLPEGSKFCPKCGKRTTVVCSSCGKELPEAARYCPFCGSVVDEKVSKADLEKKELPDQAIVASLEEKVEDNLMKSNEPNLRKEIRDYLGRGELESPLTEYKNPEEKVGRVKVAKTRGGRWWILGLAIALLVGLVGLGAFLLESSEDYTDTFTKEVFVDYTDSFTKEVLKNPAQYVGKEITLTLDKAKYFGNSDVWEQTRKYVEQEANGLTVRYEGGRVFIVGDSDLNRIALVNVGPTVNIKGAKAVKLTGILELRGFTAPYKLEAYKVEPISATIDFMPPTPTETSPIGDTRISSLIKDLENPAYHNSAIKALVEIGSPAVEPLINALKHTDRDVRIGAAKALGKLGDPRAIEPLKRTLNDGDSDVRIAALEALEELGWKPRSLSTGTFIVKELREGYGGLIIENGLQWDAIVILSKLENPKKPLLSVYVRSSDSYTIDGIPDGVYMLYFAVGKDWNSDSKKFTITNEYRRFDEELKFKTTIIGNKVYYDTYTVTLHPVMGGTATTEEVDETNFPKLS